MNNVSERVGEELFDKFVAGADEAVAEAVPTSSGWGAHKNDGGMMCITYKATVRRQGVFSGASGFVTSMLR